VVVPTTETGTLALPVALSEPIACNAAVLSVRNAPQAILETTVHHVQATTTQQEEASARLALTPAHAALPVQTAPLVLLAKLDTSPSPLTAPRVPPIITRLMVGPIARPVLG
jgi:hypothetical protein